MSSGREEWEEGEWEEGNGRRGEERSGRGEAWEGRGVGGESDIRRVRGGGVGGGE